MGFALAVDLSVILENVSRTPPGLALLQLMKDDPKPLAVAVRTAQAVDALKNDGAVAELVDYLRSVSPAEAKKELQEALSACRGFASLQANSTDGIIGAKPALKRPQLDEKIALEYLEIARQNHWVFEFGGTEITNSAALKHLAAGREISGTQPRLGGFFFDSVKLGSLAELSAWAVQKNYTGFAQRNDDGFFGFLGV